MADERENLIVSINYEDITFKDQYVLTFS